MWVAERRYLEERGREDVAFLDCSAQFLVQRKLVDAFAKEVEDVWAVSLVGGSESKRAFAEMLLKATQG